MKPDPLRAATGDMRRFDAALDTLGIRRIGWLHFLHLALRFALRSFFDLLPRALIAHGQAAMSAILRQYE